MSLSARVRVLLAVLLAACVAVAGASCRDAEPGRGRPAASADGRRPVDSTLLAFLSKARAAHHQADMAEARGDRAEAVAQVRRITEGARPPPTPEVVEVLADAHARLGELLSAEGQFDEAVDEIGLGLELAKDDSHFRGHLFEIWGVIEHRRMEGLESVGDHEGAERSRRIAIEKLEKAIEIQERVLERAIPSGEPVEVPTNVLPQK